MMYYSINFRCKYLNLFYRRKKKKKRIRVKLFLFSSYIIISSDAPPPRLPHPVLGVLVPRLIRAHQPPLLPPSPFPSPPIFAATEQRCLSDVDPAACHSSLLVMTMKVQLLLPGHRQVLKP